MSQTETNVNVENELKLKDLDQSDPKLEKLLRYSSFYYLVFFIFFGLPVWYATTTTYRADLPFDEIQKFSSIQYEYQSNIELIYLNEAHSKSDLVSYERSFFTAINQNSNPSQRFSLNFKGKLRVVNENEKNLFKGSNSLKELDQKLNEKEFNVNKLKIYLLDDQNAQRLGLTNAQIKLYNCLYTHEKQNDEFKSLIKYIMSNYFYLNQLLDIYNGKQNLKRKMPSKDELRKLEFDSDYELTFSLINSMPQGSNLNLDIESSIQSYFTTVIDQLSKYANFSVKSQRLLYSEFDSYSIASKKPSNEKEQASYNLNPSDLSIMTNFIESRLGAQITQSTTINFVTYIPNKQPLRIANSESNLNAFLIPRWGGIYIYNHLSEQNNAMKIFLTQFLQLIDINLQNADSNEERSKLYSSELYSYLMRTTFENLLNSINTLESLASLLEKISNMVIADDIGKQVQLSVDSIKSCLNNMKLGKLDDAFFASKTAFISSEKAFFDPSLLELLYFPEDQKFAIYIPLFIPVSLPLMISIKSIVKWIKAQKQKEKTQ